MTTFASLVQDYVRLKEWAPPELPEGRMVALVGDAELDEGNVYEALHDGWKHDVRNTWWVIDYNRQSLDAVVTDRLFGQIEQGLARRDVGDDLTPDLAGGSATCEAKSLGGLPHHLLDGEERPAGVQRDAFVDRAHHVAQLVIAREVDEARAGVWVVDRRVLARHPRQEEQVVRARFVTLR